MTMAIITCFLAVVVPLITPIFSIAESNVSLLVSAAASMKDALEEIKPIYEQSKPNINIKFNFGASGALQQQIEQGAPADIFISAARKQIDALEQKGLLVPGTRTNLASNRLVLIVGNNTTAINNFFDLTDTKIKKIAVGEPRSVPAGQYADQVLKKLGIFEGLKPKLVLANNVRQVLASVESGNADAGLVYATDAKISHKVKVVVTADEKYHSPIIYPMAIIKSSKNIPQSRQFVTFLSGSQAQIVLKKYGFIVK
jgi:molybdate transport system substrate-binding protein